MPLYNAGVRSIADVGEFGLIARIQRAVSGPGRAVRLGIGDDAALLRPEAGQDLVISTDACVEDVHFRWRNVQARTLGRRAMLAALPRLRCQSQKAQRCDGV